MKNIIIRIMIFSLLLLIPIYLPLTHSRAQSGVLLPSNSDEPDASILSLQVMNVDVRIDNQHATVRVFQIFDNHTHNTLEGKYLFALPPTASISDFAIWEDDTRIPGVIMERRRAEQIYTDLTTNQIDPGLLEQDDEHGGTSAFSCKVFPIPAYGSKRIELTYTEMLPVEALASHFTFPLKASFGELQSVGEFNLHLEIVNDYPIRDIKLPSKTYPLSILKSNANQFEAEYHATDIELSEDFSVDYQINIANSNLSFIAYRAPEYISAYDLRNPALAVNNPDGYFAASVIFNQKQQQKQQQIAPRNLILLLDTSLSMHGEKLARAVEAIEFLLQKLRPSDSFNLLLFNEKITTLSPQPVPGTRDNIKRAIDLIHESMLIGATDISQALIEAVAMADKLPAGQHNIVLISDANPTLGKIATKELQRLFQRKDQQTPRLFAFGLGSDSNNTLLSALTELSRGDYQQARETENIANQLEIFFTKLGDTNIDNIRFTASEKENFYQIYPIDQSQIFDQSSYTFVGRYKQPRTSTQVGISALYGNDVIELIREVFLPELDDTHGHLPRLWARARVDVLLREIDLNGEREDYIAEIIRLSQKYKFVTPYTAFLAAPRALLRPRLIQPGDPVIRVKTDPNIQSVFAVLPFGETLPLQYLPDEQVWQTRFLAPPNLPDGTYHCRLLLTDRNGNGYQEEKSFVIDSHAPKLTATLSTQIAGSGDEIIVRVNADRDTAKLMARIYGAAPIPLKWSRQEQACVGRLRVPSGLAAGKYLITITAEDFAYNQSSLELPVEVLAR